MKTSIYFFIFLFCTGMLLACGPATEIKEIFDLRNAIQDKCQCSGVNVQMTNDSLSVILSNSHYKDSSGKTKLQLATEIGTMSKQYIKSGITEGTLSFKNEHNHLASDSINISVFPMFSKKQ